MSMGIRPDQVDAVYSALIALDDAKYVMDRYLEISLPRLFIENSDLPEQAYTNLGLWNSAKFNEVARAEVSNIRLACSDAGLPGVLERWTRFKSVLAHVAHTLSVNPERFDQLEAVLEEIETARRVIRRANEVKDQNTEAKGQK